MLDTRQLLIENVVVMDAATSAFAYAYRQMMVTHYLARDKRREEMGCVGVCTASRKWVKTGDE